MTLFLHRRELRDLRDVLTDTLAALTAGGGNDDSPANGDGDAAGTATDRAA